ncbi:retrovirus-related pol polyprotein from transposon TNT 1-94 [Tanacetum coccineum]
MIQVRLNATVQNIRIDNGSEFVNQTLRAYYEDFGISHQTSVARTPQQNGVAEAVATACFTQNRSLIQKRHNKTPYELIHKKKPDLSYLHVFGALCYPTNDSEDLIVAPDPADSTGSPSSTSVDQDVPCPNNDPFFGVSIPEPNSEESSSRIRQLQNEVLFCYFDAFLSSDEPKNYKEALKEACWIEAMQEELNEFDRLEVWELVPRPDRVIIITLKLIFKVKLDELGGVLKNKARLVARGYSQEEGIDFEEYFASVSLLEGHKILYFICRLYEHDRLLNQCQDGVLKWLNYAPRAWYDLLSSFLLSQKFSKGAVDPTLFTQKEGKDILQVQIYVDDIIFALIDPSLCDSFSEIMCLKFKMSMMGKMSFFLGLQISQSPRGIFLNQSKYALEIIKKYRMESTDRVDTPMVEKSKLDADTQGKEVDPTRYRGMIGSLMYLTSSRPDLVFAVCMCVRYQAKPTDVLSFIHT